MFLLNFKTFLRFQFANQFIFMLLFQDHKFNLQTQPPTLRVNFKSFYLCYFFFFFFSWLIVNMQTSINTSKYQPAK